MPGTRSAGQALEQQRPEAVSAGEQAAEQVGDGRVGEDARRRGWFWHWNNIITQYAPLLGLKGVGLLNSYTVWTDRREESPHRGYAFPSQQAEAAFYGEERAELITINKILVALDLIEIRKEMLPRTDSQGRRWKVPHNLYRVKDRPDGIGLRALDVIRVIELAEQDADVYRYIRRVFSSRFAPIDRDNVWHAILEELAGDPRWARMRERVAEQEARASARTRAGHAARAGRAGSSVNGAALTNGQNIAPSVADDEQIESPGGEWATTVGASNGGSGADETAVVPSNSGSPVAVAPSNEGMGGDALGAVAASNSAPAADVGQSNTTQYQAVGTTTTTTTTGNGHLDTGLGDPRAGSGEREQPEAGRSLDDRQRSLGKSGRVGGGFSSLAAGLGDALAARAASSGAGAGGRDADTAGGGSDGAGSAIDAAGARDEWAARPDPVGGRQGDSGEPDHLGHSERSERSERNGQAAPAGPVRGGAPDPASGPDAERGLDSSGGRGPVGDPSPLVVSLFEAANDRRATPLERLLLAELERAADPAARAAGSSGADLVAAAVREAVSSGSAYVAPKRIQEIVNRWAGERSGRFAPAPGSAPAVPPLEPEQRPGAAVQLNGAGTPDEAVPAVRLPGGRSGRAVWSAVLEDLARLLDSAAFERLLAGSAIVSYRRGCVEVRVASLAAAEKLSTEYHALVARTLNARLSRPVDLRFEAAEQAPVEAVSPPQPDETAPAVSVGEADAAAGRQLWRSLLVEIGPALAPGDAERLAEVVPLAQDPAGRLLLGAPTRHVARLLDGRYRIEIERVFARLFGRPALIQPVDPGDWTIAG